MPLRVSILDSVTIPDSVTRIGWLAFQGCTGLAEITLRAVVPPTLGDECFHDVDTQIPLHVPSVSVEASQSSDGWNAFSNIQCFEDGTDGIDDMDGMAAKVYSANGQIVVENTDGNTVILYDAAGRVMATRQSVSQTVTFDVPATGTYLVKVGNAPARRIVVVK